MSKYVFRKTLLALACGLSLLGSGCQSDFESGLVVGAGLTGLVVGTIALVSEVNPESIPTPPQTRKPSGHNRPGGIRYIFVRDQPVYSSFNSGPVSTDSHSHHAPASTDSSSSTRVSGSDSGTRDTTSSSEQQHSSNENTSSSSPREVVIEPATTQDALLELPEWLKP